jgi:translin
MLFIPVVEQGMRGSFDEIDKQLKDTQERRENLIKGTRDAIILSSKSIVSMHQGRMGEAAEEIEQASVALDNLRTHAQADLYKYLVVAEQELVEANALRSIMTGAPIQSRSELRVSGGAYLTGLLDCIGEIKRLVYDRMRSGNEEDVERLFGVMQDLYSAVYPFAAYDNIVPGLRKKLDIARILIEDIRAVVTEESRRRALIQAVWNLEKKLQPGSL